MRATKRIEKITLISSGGLTLLFLGLNSVGTFRLCGGIEYGACMDTMHGALGILIPAIPFFVFSLITYFLRKEVFATWIKFAVPWAIVSMVLVALAPTYGAGGQFAMPDLSYTKDMAVFLTTVVAVVVSLLIVVIRSIWLKAQSK